MDYLSTRYQLGFAVIFGQKVLGIVTRDDVMQALATQPHVLYVSEVMRREVDDKAGKRLVERLLKEAYK